MDGIILCRAPCISAPPEASVASQPNRLDVRAIVLFANFAVDAIIRVEFILNFLLWYNNTNRQLQGIYERRFTTLNLVETTKSYSIPCNVNVPLQVVRANTRIRKINLRPPLVTHPLITARTPPHLNRLRLFFFRLKHHVCLTCIHLRREN